MNLLRSLFSLIVLYNSPITNAYYSPNLNPLKMSEFENFVFTFNKSYASQNEYLYRA